MRWISVLFALLALAAPATAPAALKIGIAENDPDLFADPLFTDLAVRYARVVVSYDVMTSGDDELQRVTDHLATSRAATAAAAGSWSPTSSTAPTTRGPRRSASARRCATSSASAAR